MAYPNRLKPLLVFDDCADGVDGVIFKAGFQNSDTDANGIGVSGTATGSALTFTEGGISTSTTNNGSTNNVKITIDSAVHQASLRGSGRIQFDIKTANLYLMETQNVGIFGLYNAANTDADGPRVLFNGGTGRASKTNDKASVYVNTLNYGVLCLDANWGAQRYEAEDSQGAICIAGETDTWTTLTISWTPTMITWLHNGHTVTRTGRATSTADLTYLWIQLIATTLNDRLPIRNLILCDHPAPDTHKVKGYNIPNVVAMGHSFWNTGGGLGEDGYDSIEDCGCIKQLTSNIHYQYVKKYGALNFTNLAHDGSVTDDTPVSLTHANSMTGSQLTWDWTNTEVIPNRIHSRRPDIAVLMVAYSDPNDASGETSVDTNLTTILDSLKANGVIPIMIREQNRDAGGVTKTLIDPQVQTTVAAWIAANTDWICPIVDMWTPTGGSTVNTDYVETTGQVIHPSYDVGELYGVAIANAIHQALVDAPSGSRWATR